MSKSFDQAELFELCNAIVDEHATDEQIERLNKILDGNPEAQREYSTYMMLHAEIFWHADLFAPQAQPVASAHNVVWPANSLSWNNSISKLSLAAMLMLGAGLGMMLVWAWTPTDIAPVVSSDVVEAVDRQELVARITGTRNCRWALSENNELIGFDSPIYAGQELRLVDGLAEITFLSGVRVILQAPARLDMSSLDRSVLHEGKLTASVPKGAEGFQIACRGITIVDRGTEFGLNSKKSGETEVRVFQGLVDGFVRTNDSGTFRKVSWKTNDSAQFSPETRQITAVDQPSNFVRSLSQSISSQQGILASEDFDYPVGQLAGQNGGYGWGNPWDNISVEEGQPQSNEIGPGSIPIEGIDHLGNHAVLSGQFNRIRRILGTSFSGVFDTAGLIENQDGARLVGKDGRTIYISFTQRVDKPEDVFYGFELNRGDGNANRVLCVGHAAARAWIEGPPKRPNKEAGVTGWAVTSEFNGQDNQLLDLGDLGQPGTKPVLVVLRIDFGKQNKDRVTVYVDPQSLVDESSCTPRITGSGNFAFDRVSLANFEGDKLYEVDHIRIGTAFAAVTQRTDNLEFISQLPIHENDD